MRDLLIELIQKGQTEYYNSFGNNGTRHNEYIADYLLANGVIVPQVKEGVVAYVMGERATRFTVIDNETGLYPDCEYIAFNEEWAKHLIYSDIDTFAINEDGVLMLLDECGNAAFCPADRFTVIFEKGGADMGGETNDNRAEN